MRKTEGIEQLNQMFACLHLPDLPSEARLLTNPELRHQPCAILTDESLPGASKTSLLSVNSVARFYGVHPGDPPNHARLRCPHLHFLPRDPEAEKSLHVRLLHLAESLSPDFEQSHPDTLLVDLAGSCPPEIWDPPPPQPRLAFANTPDLARIAALHNLPFSNQPVQPKDLDPLPVKILHHAGAPDASALLALFDLWGLRTLGDFRRLPHQEVAERMGRQAAHWHDVLHGKRQRLLRLHRPIESFVVSMHFEAAIETLEALIFQVNRTLQTLCARLQASYLAAGKIRFKLMFDSFDFFERSLDLPEPRNDPSALLVPLHAAFENHRTPAAITGLELELFPVRPHSAQREWLGRQLRQPERWPETLAKLEALLGPGRVGIPHPEDSHRPDDFRLFTTAERLPKSATHPSTTACPLPLRRFRPPLDVAVASTRRNSSPHPQALLTGPHPGPIRRLRGPFPSSGTWWNHGNAWQRLEWDIELESRHLLRLVLLPPDRWQLDGAYL